MHSENLKNHEIFILEIVINTNINTINLIAFNNTRKKQNRKNRRSFLSRNPKRNFIRNVKIK